MAAMTVMKAVKKANAGNPGTQQRGIPAPARFVPARPSDAPALERIPRVMRQKVEALLEESYAFMDSPVFKQRNIERELFSFEDGLEPQLPMTS